ncbi:MAG: ATP-dependent DNA helicase RecG [Caldilineales bacterium]|nr:ATP-dependent DNA helicase RecG [Caldilineales bacterium]MDW8318111.1 ATP-dependent DNA helicase RecG [Anaerolineae bacterium]
MSPPSAIERLRRILKQEEHLGYRNKAVIGGLERLSERWSADAQTECVTPDQQRLVQRIVAGLVAYSKLSTQAERRQAVEALHKLIDQWATVDGAPPAAEPGEARPLQAEPAEAPARAPQPEPTEACALQPEPAEPPAASTSLATGPAAPPAEPAEARAPAAEPAEARAPAAEPVARAEPGEARPPQAEPAEAPTAKPVEPPVAPTSSATGRAAPPAEPVEARPTPVGHANLQASVSRLPGVGPKHTERLARLGVHTVGELLYLLPRRYVDYTALKPIVKLRYGEQVTIVANLWDLKSQRLPGRNATIVTGVLSDSTASLKVTWFNPYVIKQLRVGKTYVFSGKVDAYLGQLVMRNPDWEPLEREQVHTGRLVPIYPLTQGISERWMRDLQWQAVQQWGRRVVDYLPAAVRQRAGLMSLAEALEHIHFPASQQHLAEARRRLAFDELFQMQIGLLRQRRGWVSLPAQPFPLAEEADRAFRSALPFAYTAAQERVVRDILADLAQPRPMSRLLQGDVGSGKTVVAAHAMWAVVANGAQAAMMAPTEILAEQHYRSLSKLFERVHGLERPVRIALITGSLRPAERVEVLRELAEGQIDIAVGTHALIQEGVEFHRLGLAIIDEQHRFGVRQRAALRQRNQGANGAATPVPHLLVMSATPIPRTLALTLFGDLDVSVIDEMPPGRQPIKTRWMLPRERERAYAFIRRQVQAGRQAFIIYPLVEESESLDVGAAVPQYEQLCQEVFPDLRLGLLHGRLKSQEKEAVMHAMQRGDIDILVATAVVEVGVDIPNASVILIEDAERFGLAQLHQFRGRVGRGEHPSYCILISGATEGDAVERLRALEEIQDGFALAEKDLALRGPGDFFGVRQSGLPDLRVAQFGDLRILELARREAERLLAEDPDLAKPEHQPLSRRVNQFWHGEGDIS